MFKLIIGNPNGPWGSLTVENAKAIRFGRGWPAGFYNAQHLIKGWRMTVVPTDASRRRHRRQEFLAYSD